MPDAQGRELRQLARLHGVQIGYYDIIARRLRRASLEALLAMLRALEAPVETLADVPAALRERQQQLWRRVLEPVVVAWDLGPRRIPLRLPAAWADRVVACTLALESGEHWGWTVELGSLPVEEGVAVEGGVHIVKSLTPPAGLPWGYHRLHLEIEGSRFEALFIIAPLHAYGLPEGQARTWGVFLPLYALHSKRNPGGGDFSDLESLLDWTVARGGGLVGSLPLLASFLDEPFSPSPYTPVSSLFWNELYLDLARIPEFERSSRAQTVLGSAPFERDLKALAGSPLVDYRRLMALKRKVLEELARGFFADPGARQAAFERFLAAHPGAEDYARFRAAVEKCRAPWPTWPETQRRGILGAGDYQEESQRYHLYVQWQAEEQLQALSERARQKGPGLYLDLPLGVHRDGYDVWRQGSVFALRASAGAPPDDFFVRGQNWGVPPLHPERIREQGYRYLIATLRHHLRKAGVVRLDHIMALHRLFWIPEGLEVKDGVYVRKRADEFYAMLTLESHRHRTVIVGEDLGTVPRYVRLAMTRHKLLRSYVLQFELTPDPGRAIHPVPAGCLASCNTHDTRPFQGFWDGLDIDDRLELGLVDEAEAARLRADRRARLEALVSFLRRGDWLAGDPTDPAAVYKACLSYLGASPAQIVMVNLEDLWLETEQQNTPGTLEKRPNWRRKARYPFEEFSRSTHLLETLRELAGRGRQVIS
ncbi:MAG: 4-alpha-glucanotransferase [Acidobacteria bacterium]|nr:4-alpha-glucanotransferase [Acidobacteriota bacterium]